MAYAFYCVRKAVAAGGSADYEFDLKEGQRLKAVQADDTEGVDLAKCRITIKVADIPVIREECLLSQLGVTAHEALILDHPQIGPVKVTGTIYNDSATASTFYILFSILLPE